MFDKRKVGMNSIFVHGYYKVGRPYGKKMYVAELMVGVPVKRRYLLRGWKTASEAISYGNRVLARLDRMTVGYCDGVR